jgi:glycosyltransferase involved in cell wall biosynthesis
MQPLSVAIIARDEAARIAACLESIRALADDIVVLDSGSADGTQDLCRKFGARVVETDWPGYGAQKNRALEAAAHDWVLCLDADERVSAELSASIRRALASPQAAGFRFRRCNRFLGRALRHGEGYPDWSLRLVDRRHGRWSQDAVHERIEVDGPVDGLDGDLNHDSAESLASYVAKQNRYSSLAAEHAFSCGDRTTAARLALSPVTRFFKFYLLRLGFLDGVPGLIHIVIGCFASFLKHAKMRELQARAQSRMKQDRS